MKNQKKLYLTISIVSFVIVLVALSAIGFLFFSFKQARDDYSQLASQAKTRAGRSEKGFWNKNDSANSEMPDPVDIPVDFE